MFALQSPFTLAPGQSVTFRYAYGVRAPRRGSPRLVAKYRDQPDPLRTQRDALAAVAAEGRLRAAYAWLSRELQWDAYTVRSDATYDECAATTRSPRAATTSTVRLPGRVPRSAPAHAADDLRRPVAGAAGDRVLGPRAAGGDRRGPVCADLRLCRRYDLGTSDDLDQWLLWGTAEYALATRDYGFFNTQIPYYEGSGAGRCWDHLKLAFRHQEDVIRTGSTTSTDRWRPATGAISRPSSTR